MSNVLTTKEQVKLHLEDLGGSSSFDTLFDALILAVSQRIELAANRKLFTATRTELHHGGRSRIYVKCPPITSITSITYGPNFNFTIGTVLGVSEYVLDPTDNKNVIYSTYGNFPGGCDELKVVYVGGYVGADVSTTNIPKSLVDAATRQVVYLFKNRGSIGLDNVNLGDGLLQKINNRWLIPEVQDVVSQLRIRNVH